jgi:hypothetical protein
VQQFIITGNIFMLVKAIIILMFLAIFVSLGRALYFLVKDQGKSRRTATALKYRIGLSISLLIIVLLAFATGAIQPHGLLPVTKQEKPQTQNHASPAKLAEFA